MCCLQHDSRTSTAVNTTGYKRSSAEWWQKEEKLVGSLGLKPSKQHTMPRLSFVFAELNAHSDIRVPF